MQKSFICLFGLLVCPFLFSQILTTSSGASVSIESGTSLTLDGLEIAPSNTYVITENNVISRSSTAATSKGNNSINRVYTSDNLLPSFIGTLTFSYLEEELNGISEADLVLELKSYDNNWITYVGAIDQINNTVSFTFNYPVSFKAVTASAVDASLTVEDIESHGNSISVYPNPTANRIFIQADNFIQATLYDLWGRKIIETNIKQINVSNMDNGSFILEIKTTDTNKQSFIIIKK